MSIRHNNRLELALALAMTESTLLHAQTMKDASLGDSCKSVEIEWKGEFDDYGKQKTKWAKDIPDKTSPKQFGMNKRRNKKRK